MQLIHLRELESILERFIDRLGVKELRFIRQGLEVILEVVYTLSALSQGQSILSQVVNMNLQGLQSESQGAIHQPEVLRQPVDLQGENGIVNVDLIAQDEELFLTEEHILLLGIVKKSLKQLRTTEQFVSIQDVDEEFHVGSGSISLKFHNLEQFDKNYGTLMLGSDILRYLLWNLGYGLSILRSTTWNGCSEFSISD